MKEFLQKVKELPFTIKMSIVVLFLFWLMCVCVAPIPTIAASILILVVMSTIRIIIYLSEGC